MPLSDLASALAAATGPSRELDERIATEVFGLLEARAVPYADGDFGAVQRSAPAYTRSLDAITGALEQRWPGIGWRAEFAGAADPEPGWGVLWPHAGATIHGITRTPCLALSLAAVRLAMREAGDG